VRYWGVPGDIPVSGDLDGDGLTDLIVWRPSNGTWYAALSTKNFDATNGANVLIRAWGEPGDIPVSGDLDGDGMTDLIVWRPSNGTWYGAVSSTNFDATNASNVLIRAWGSAGDVPVGGDFDADGRMDLAVFRQSNQKLYVVLSGHLYDATSRVFTVTSAGSGDVAVNGSLDLGDRPDLITFDTTNGIWNVALSSHSWNKDTGLVLQHGGAGDMVPAMQ
jgi:hypothetical protein